MSTTQNFTTTFKYNLTCIFLSLRAKLKNTLQCETPCMQKLGKITIVSKGKEHSFSLAKTFYGDLNIKLGMFLQNRIHRIIIDKKPLTYTIQINHG